MTAKLFAARELFMICLAVCLALGLAGCAAPTPPAAPTTLPSATLPPTSTLTDTPTLPPTLTPTPSSTPEPSQTPAPTLTFTPAASPTATVDPAWLTVKSAFLTLRYPDKWKLLPPEPHAPCGDPADCIVDLGHATPGDLKVHVWRDPPGVPALADVIEADMRDWNRVEFGSRLVGFPDRLKPISWDEICLDGLKAVRRLYEYPLVDPATMKLYGTQYNYQVMVMKGKDLYTFRMLTTSADDFAAFIPTADGMVYSIVFQK